MSKRKKKKSKSKKKKKKKADSSDDDSSSGREQWSGRGTGHHPPCPWLAHSVRVVGGGQFLTSPWITFDTSAVSIAQTVVCIFAYFWCARIFMVHADSEGETAEAKEIEAYVESKCHSLLRRHILSPFSLTAGKRRVGRKW